MGLLMQKWLLAIRFVRFPRQMDVLFGFYLKDVRLLFGRFRTFGKVFLATIDDGTLPDGANPTPLPIPLFLLYYSEA